MQPKKRFGQNWLVDQTVVKNIIEASNLKPGETVIEIGPGQGVLTAALLDAGANVIAIEKDRDLIPILKEKFNDRLTIGASRSWPFELEIIEGDVRDLDIKDLTRDQPYKLVANIPYYITGLIMRKFLSAAHQPTSMTLLVQREVADRVIARNSKESVLSLSVKAYGEPSKVRNVKAGAFRPIPSVGSAVLKIDNISKDWFKNSNISEEYFFKIVKMSFNQKRKTLSASCGVVGKYARSRPEDLNLVDWVNLINNNPHL